MAKTRIKPATAAAFFLQCPSFGTVLYRNSTKEGALAFKIQLVGGAFKDGAHRSKTDLIILSDMHAFCMRV